VGLFSWLTLNTGVFILVLMVVVLILAGTMVWLAVRLRKTEARYRALVEGTSGGNLESMLTEHMVQVRDATGRVVELDELARRLERASRSYLQRVGFLRFNPFRDAGGDQSFAVAMTDQDGNGVVISSLHSRDVTRVYGKPLAGWASPYSLTEEEEQAIKKARDQGAGTRDQESVTSNR
jgi:PAS domain-containing protein